MPTFGSPLLRYESVDSTNDIARDLAVGGASEGLCVIARAQTAGRGRQGRSWSSPPGEGLYLSIVLRPDVEASKSALITLGAAVAIAETLRLDFHTVGDIKWPNDVLVNGRKICGILVEAAIEGDRLQYAIMGIGVNIAQRSFPDDIEDSATSILLETGRVIETDDFVKAMIARLEPWYLNALQEPQRVISRWQVLSSSGRDCRVLVESGDGYIEGVTRGLTPSGALVVELPNGVRREITSGEVRVKPLREDSSVLAEPH